MDCEWTIGCGVDCVPENDFVADFDACLGIYVAWDGECWGGVGSGIGLAKSIPLTLKGSKIQSFGVTLFYFLQDDQVRFSRQSTK